MTLLQHLKDTSYMKEEKAGCDFINASKTEENSREISAQEMVAPMADAVSTYEGILTDNVMSSSDNPSSEDTQLLPKPSPSYIALIAKVILSSPLQKLNLASIYRAMEEQFPYLRSRGPGWRNSVRHNLSVNDCFVKVSRCEDGRGHYWGVHQAHLRDFQQGNFRQSRKARGRRERERYDEVAGCLAWMETSCFLGKFYESRTLGCVEPQCPLQEPRSYQLSSLDWTQPRYQPWIINVGWVQSPSWMKRYCLPERLPDTYGGATAGRGYDIQPMTSRLHCWEMNDSVLTGTKESYDSRFMTPPVQAVRFPGCWCIKELIKPLSYKVNL
uniref:Fork-head domain-containing protein n=1 Tax=Dicentrarchus labrax TaxID=13489 RepID=A0A8C4IEG7_DICLA